MSVKEFVSEWWPMLSIMFLGIGGAFSVQYISGGFSETTYVGEVINYQITYDPWPYTRIELITHSDSSVVVCFGGIVEPNIGDTVKITVTPSWRQFHQKLIEFKTIDYTERRTTQ